jgi:hypothetical protein
MNLRRIHEDEMFLTGRRYAHAIRTALIFLLLGGGCLGVARILGLSGSYGSIARVAELLGWGALASSTAVLLIKWLDSRELTEPVNIRIENFDAQKLHGREAAIDRLYSELRPLLSRAATDPSLKEEAQRKLSLLRKLQDEEADEIQRRFEASSLLKPGEGRRALDRADEILARYEDPSSAHAPTQQKN